jgi:6-pyruvoyltetrahydropterin/6-carboxytetrahydropterin synthase
MPLTLTMESHLEVAHYMPDFPEGHPNRRLHGHSYIVRVTLKSLEKKDVILDYDKFKNKLTQSLKDLDHSSVNEWKLNSARPTMENMCVFLWDHLKKEFPELSKVSLFRPTLNMLVEYEE